MSACVAFRDEYPRCVNKLPIQLIDYTHAHHPKRFACVIPHAMASAGPFGRRRLNGTCIRMCVRVMRAYYANHRVHGSRIFIR